MKKPNRKPLLLLAGGLCLLLLLWGAFSFYQGRQYASLCLGDCISYEFVTPSGSASGSFSSVNGLTGHGFQPQGSTLPDIGERLQKAPPESPDLVPLFTLSMVKPGPVAQQGDQTQYQDGPRVPISVSLVGPQAPLDPSLDPATLEYRGRRLLLTVGGSAYRLNHPAAFVQLFDQAREALPPVRADALFGRL